MVTSGTCCSSFSEARENDRMGKGKETVSFFSDKLSSNFANQILNFSNKLLGNKYITSILTGLSEIFHMHFQYIQNPTKLGISCISIYQISECGHFRAL